MKHFRELCPTSKRRNHWCTLWMKTRPERFFHSTTAYKTKRRMAEETWLNMSTEQVEQMWLDMARQHDGIKARGAPAGNNNAQKKESEEILATAVMVCWNVPPCSDPEFVQLFQAVRQVDPEDVAYDALLENVASISVVRKSWTEFSEFLQELKRDSLWKEESVCMELSLHADEPRWHFHAFFFRISACNALATIRAP